MDKAVCTDTATWTETAMRKPPRQRRWECRAAANARVSSVRWAPAAAPWGSSRIPSWRATAWSQRHCAARASFQAASLSPRRGLDCWCSAVRGCAARGTALRPWVGQCIAPPVSTVPLYCLPLPKKQFSNWNRSRCYVACNKWLRKFGWFT